MAPGIIATAGHFFSNNDLVQQNAEVTEKGCDVDWIRAKVVLHSPEVDFCLLQCKRLNDPQRFLPLATSEIEFRLGSQFVGHTPREKKQYLVSGEDFYATVVGFSTEPTLLNIQSKPQIVKSMSGSPVADLESGMVVGLVVQGYCSEDVGRVLAFNEIWKHFDSLRLPFAALNVGKAKPEGLSHEEILQFRRRMLLDVDYRQRYALISKCKEDVREKIRDSVRYEISNWIGVLTFTIVVLLLFTLIVPLRQMIVSEWPMYRVQGHPTIGTDIGLGEALTVMILLVIEDATTRLLGVAVLLLVSIIIGVFVASGFFILPTERLSICRRKVRIRYSSEFAFTGIMWELGGKVVHQEAVSVVDTIASQIIELAKKTCKI